MCIIEYKYVKTCRWVQAFDRRVARFLVGTFSPRAKYIEIFFIFPYSLYGFLSEFIIETFRISVYRK